jgi:hypothetical protein
VKPFYILVGPDQKGEGVDLSLKKDGSVCVFPITSSCLWQCVVEFNLYSKEMGY